MTARNGWLVELALWPLDGSDESPITRVFGPTSADNALRLEAMWKARVAEVVAAGEDRYVVTVAAKRLHPRSEFEVELAGLVDLYDDLDNLGDGEEDEWRTRGADGL